MLPKARFDSDLTTWTLENPVVRANQIIYVNAEDPNQKLTKREVIKLVRLLVGGFRHENGNEYLDGTTICVHSFNSILYPVLFHGIIAAGGCFTGTNPAYTVEELMHHFLVSKTEFILTEINHYLPIAIAALRSGIPESHIFVLHREDQQPGSNARSWTELLQHGQSDWLATRDESELSSTPAALFSTSGTSGLPKIAVRSHKSLIQECIGIHDDIEKPYTESRLICVPMFHAFTSPLANISALRYGVKTFIMPRFKEYLFLHTISSFGITETAVVPPILVKFLLQPIDARRESLRPLRLVWCAGAPLHQELQRRVAGDLLFLDARVVQVYGLTECGWASTFKYPESDDTGSVGRLLPGFEAKLIDDAGNELHSPSERGEILLKSPSMMSEYLENPAATLAAFDYEGWYWTGDVARIENGKIYIVDRKKELIKVRGWQVSPAELECVLLKHEYIVDAAVVGLKLHGEDLYEIPKAYVVCQEGIRLKAQEVKNFMLQYLARYKWKDHETRDSRANVSSKWSTKWSTLVETFRVNFLEQLQN